jgi:hypothetical protein
MCILMTSMLHVTSLNEFPLILLFILLSSTLYSILPSILFSTLSLILSSVLKESTLW